MKQTGRLFALAQAAMAELENITETLRRQRRDLDEMINTTSKGSDETAELLRRIEDLKRRSEQTQRQFEIPIRKE